jgi:hypothetical protein
MNKECFAAYKPGQTLLPSRSLRGFALVCRTVSRDYVIALADGKNCTRNARFQPSQPLRRSRRGVRHYCAAFLLLSTICYLSAVALAKADQPLPAAASRSDAGVVSTPAQAAASASAEAMADRSAQLAPTWKPREKEPLEKYDMPPMYIYRLDTSPRMISQFGVFVSYQVNVDASGQNIVGDAANECSISVDPTDSTKMAVGWRQFDSVLSNFRQGGWGYTTDGGVTWTFPGVYKITFFAVTR